MERIARRKEKERERESEPEERRRRNEEKVREWERVTKREVTMRESKPLSLQTKQTLSGQNTKQSLGRTRREIRNI